ncbi:hypothetical protein [Pseudomonas sp. Ga0074129]|uniref:hypothetical protein n=1 Tax=Pseudomonas sp. Ga0074129 TaxID=1752219 RepID=UPI0025F069C7|nr:hypothetical protein [Pseudomonas sp. Ga0074129]
MDNQQRYFGQRPLIEVGGRAVLNTFAPATGGIQPHNKLLERAFTLEQRRFKAKREQIRRLALSEAKPNNAPKI